MRLRIYTHMTEIERIRIKLHLTQQQFGKRLGVTQATVSRWESGDLPIRERDLLAVRALELEAA